MAQYSSTTAESRNRRDLIVRMHRDRAGWWAESDDIPGLATEASSYALLQFRVHSIVPELCKANGVELSGSALSFQVDTGERAMVKRELDEELSMLGDMIWSAIQSDDNIQDKLWELTDLKLALENVPKEALNLSENAAEAIYPEDGASNVVRPKNFVPPSEWAKNAVVSLALDWVVDKALAHMKLNSRWPFQQNDAPRD